MTNDYPTPDPNWDYAGVWSHAEQISTKLLALNAYLVTVEGGTPETDKQVRQLLEAMLVSVEGATAARRRASFALLPPQ